MFEGGTMEKELREFLSGISNVEVVTVKLIREKSKNGYEYITMETVDGHRLYGTWYNPEIAQRSKKPKHIGGQAAYTKLMTAEVAKLIKNGCSHEALGALVALSDCVEWDTGRLLQKRSKRPLSFDDLQKIWQTSKSKTTRLIQSMKTQKVLEHSQGCYSISNKLLRKGKSAKGGENSGTANNSDPQTSV